MNDTPCDDSVDEYDRRLLDQVRPPDWRNPAGDRRYDLVVIGAGTAGLVTAAGAAGLGARVALIEQRRLGGDCLNYGCVPSKALIAAARAAASIRNAGRFGVRPGSEPQVDFEAVMRRMRRLRSEIARHDSAARFRELGVDLFLGSARFEEGGKTICVDDRTLRFRKAAVCTGSRPAVPDVKGLTEAGFLTNETVFSLTQRPGHLALLGGGPIGCELAQAFSHLGCQVTLIEHGPRLLKKDDVDAASIVEQALVRDGVRLMLKSQLQEVLPHAGGRRLVIQQEGGTHEELDVDDLLVAVGRTPNVEGLNLDSAGIEHDSKQGIIVDDHLRTTNRRIFAAGDVCSSYRFTHAADFMARIVIRNALFFGRARVSRLLIPWCTYTSPELAQVGLTEADAHRQGIAIDTLTQELSSVDRAVLDGEAEGFVRLHLKQGSDRILGATIVAAHAGELISGITVAMRNGIGLRAIGESIHPYPTQAEAIRKLADVHNRGRLTPTVKKLLGLWFR